MFELIWYSVGPWALEVWGTGPVFAVMIAIMVSIVTLNRVLPANRIRSSRQAQPQRQQVVVARHLGGAAPKAPIGDPVAASASEYTVPDVAPDPDADGDNWRTYTTENGAVVQELGEPFRTLGEGEHRDLLLRLRLELAEARGVAEALRGDAVARVRGRLHSWRGPVAVLAVPDGEGHQRVLVSVPDADERQSLAVGMRVEVIAKFAGGRLVAERFIEAEMCSEPMPDLPEPTAKPGAVPDWFDSNAKNEKRALLKASDGSSSVSDLKVHIVFATKRRGAVLTAPMVERFKQLAAQAVEEKGLGALLGANSERDHCHLALWLPVNVAPSDAMGQIKSFTSRHLRKEFPALIEHHADALWQRGGFVGSIGNGGDLSVVLKYIANQDAPEAVQDDQEGASDLTEDSAQGDR